MNNPTPSPKPSPPPPTSQYEGKRLTALSFNEQATVRRAVAHCKGDAAAVAKLLYVTGDTARRWIEEIRVAG